MKIKKIISMLLVLGTVATSFVFAAGSRKDIDKFLKSYEEFVVKAEKAAEKNDLASLQKLSLEAAKFAEEVDDLDTGDDWTIADLQKYTNLTNRYTNAISKMYGTTTDLDSLYGNFSF